jgi:drug/metabolite transporter (DMT)-like permease
MSWILFALGAALASGLMIVIEKKALMKEHAMEFSAVFAIFSFIVSLVFLPKVNFNLPFQSYIFIYIASLFITAILFFEAKGIRHLEVSVAAPLLNLGPALTAIFAFIVLGETISYINVGGILLIVIGAYILESNKLSIHILEPLKKIISHKHTLYIIAAMVLLSVLVIINKSILTTIDVYTFIFLYSGFTAINFTLLIHKYHDGIKGIIHGVKNAGRFIIIMSVLLLMARLLYFNALTIAKASLVFPIVKMNAFFSTIIGGALFHEHHYRIRIIASLVMVLGVILVAI